MFPYSVWRIINDYLKQYFIYASFAFVIKMVNKLANLFSLNLCSKNIYVSFQILTFFVSIYRTRCPKEVNIDLTCHNHRTLFRDVFLIKCSKMNLALIDSAISRLDLTRISYHYIHVHLNLWVYQEVYFYVSTNTPILLVTQSCLSCKSLKCLLLPYFLQSNMGNEWEKTPMKSTF